MLAQLLAASLCVTACGESDPVGPGSSETLYNYGNATAYLPEGVEKYKVAIVFLPGLRDPATGNPLDSRGLVRGGAEPGCSIWCYSTERTFVRNRALALAGGQVALFGTTTLEDNATSYTTLIKAITEVGKQSGHPELATIPILFVGHSMGGCTAYGFTQAHGSRVAGFLTMKGACHAYGLNGATPGIPGFFLIGNLDESYRRANITGVFEAGRKTGSPWAISIDPYYHGPIVDFELMFTWIEAVLAARLPLTAGGPLRAMTNTSAWLGDRSTGAIAAYDCYGATVSTASWLPSHATALRWQMMAGGSAVVSAC
jgi:hypothetical protein